MILVVGGTGRLGSAFVRRRLGRGETVRVLTRDPRRAVPLGPDVEVTVGDITEPATLGPALEGARIVLAAAHGFAGPGGVSPRRVDFEGNVKLLGAARESGARVLLMSVVGAAPDSPMELFRMKAAAERHAGGSAVPTTIVRATAFADLWVDLFRQTAGRSGRPLVFGRGDNPINFVAVADVAYLLDLLADDDSSRGATLEIGGPDTVSFNQLAGLIGRSDPTVGPPRHVPPAVLRLMASTVGRVKAELGRQAHAALAMDRVDLTFDGGSARSRYPQIPATPLDEVIGAASRSGGAAS